MEQINKPKISFVTVYNDFSVGVNVFSSLLIEAGYEVQVIFFKLPAKAQQDWFSLKNTEFMEAVDSYGNIMSGNPTVNPPTDNEINL